MGAFHGTSKIKIPHFLSTIFPKGNTAKEQIRSAFQQGLKRNNEVQFHFKKMNHFHLILRGFKLMKTLEKHSY